MSKLKSSRRKSVKRQDRTTFRIHQALKAAFPDLPDEPEKVVYRYNPVSIRVRVVTSKFVGKTEAERDAMVGAAFEPLPPDETEDISFQLMLTPRESKQSARIMYREFDEPDTYV